MIDIEGGDTADRNYAAVVDVGTTTVVVHLIDVVKMTTIDAQACFNSQVVYGREVTSRIIAGEKKGAAVLQEKIIADINQLISALVLRNEISLKDITFVVCAGNAIMTHFLLGLPADNIRRNPYIAASIEPSPFRAAEVGIKINPR
ncbi:MAG: ferredoxin, partial [Kiritimatiellae bacterium]|nr:ferredoxin [Kiritimatiellia bacterium]